MENSYSLKKLSQEQTAGSLNVRKRRLGGKLKFSIKIAETRKKKSKKKKKGTPRHQDTPVCFKGWGEKTIKGRIKGASRVSYENKGTTQDVQVTGDQKKEEI